MKLLRLPRGTSREKFCEVTPLALQLQAYAEFFETIFECLLLKIVGGPPSPVGCALASLGQFFNACKNLSRQHPIGAETWSSEKVNLGGSESTCRTVLLVLLVNQTSRDFFFAERVKNRCRSVVFPTLDISIRSRDIRDRNLKLSDMAPTFARFWPCPPFFCGGWANIGT